MHLRRLLWAIPILVLAAAFETAPGQTSAPFILRISRPELISAGQPVWMRVLLQNASDHGIEVWVPHAILMFALVSIHGPSGEELPRKEGAWGFSGGMMTVRPGEVWEDTLRLDSAYNLTRPGTYTIQLKMPIADPRLRDFGKDGFVSSNSITLTVSTEAVVNSSPLALTLTGPETSVSGSDVSVRAQVRNISSQDVFFVTGLDGSINNLFCGLRTTVGPNNAVFSSNLAHSGAGVIRTIYPGSSLEATLNKNTRGFDADWVAPRTYAFQLICSPPPFLEYGKAESNVLRITMQQAPPGGPTPITLTLTGPETITVGQAARVDVVLRNITNFDIVSPVGKLNLLRDNFSVRDIHPAVSLS
jgi:hypothetical protein